MKMMLTFTLLMIPGALSFSVTGYTGGAVTITCPYDRGYTSNEKYFCKGQKPVIPRRGWCSDLIRTDVKDKWVKSERFSLYDDTTTSVFTVTITDLNEDDSDTYQCVVDIVGWTDIYTEVKLTVREDDCCEKSISLSVPSGGSVNISCKYPQSHRTDVKFLCRTSGADICAHERQTRDRDHDVLFITNVTDHRSAEYWCALQTDDHRHKIFITRVHITVTETTRSPPLFTTTTSSSSTLCLSSVQSTLVTSASPVTSSVFSDFVLIMSLYVVLVLIITGLLMLTVIRCKRHQTADADSDCEISHPGPGIYESVTHDYDEIKNIRHLTNLESATITDLNTEPLPTIPSDAPNTVYDTVHLPTIPFDSSNNVYETLQLPTIPSDTLNTVYNTLQLPTIPSDDSNAVYAAPQLHGNKFNLDF
ncbi:polymeric immunoglobulin receptor-like [Triplophysa rosa]|uniref:polymeric immunoglobulin receptor-like n=1 Tax=Triplophysa rosa TaxID=992332 RepID=UPI002545D778|nr:polymeric immunoglobulin receptor-like [Triplophysa rosa]